MFRASDRRGGGGGSSSGGNIKNITGNNRDEPPLDDPLAAMQQEQDNLSDDDNAAPDIQSEVEEIEKEDPLLLAIDDLEGRVVAALDDCKLHPGIRSSSVVGSPTVHEELATLMRPVMEVAAHTAPSVARTYYRGLIASEGIEASCEDVYQRVVSDLVLPVLLEMAQSETIPAKRCAALECFRGLWKEYHRAGSWLDSTTTGPNQGPHGAGSHSSSSSSSQPALAQTPALRAQQKRRHAKRLAREGELLRYWVQASIACTLPGAFTNAASEDAVASRGVIAASASLRPCLKHIAFRIRDADDRGANRIYAPMMKMVEGVLKKIFLSTETMGDSLRSACIKLLEIVCLCCSAKPQEQGRRRGSTNDDFSLEDLPAGHPIITREALESIAEYAFSTLRGLTLLGGQVKIDVNLLSDMMLATGGDGSPSAQLVSILKPAALAYLEFESQLPASDSENPLKLNIDRSSIEFEFLLSQKSHALAINAVSALAMNRTVFFKDAAVCLARRAADPPVYTEDGPLTQSGVLAITHQVRASCLTLLRNALSVTTNSWKILQQTLTQGDMKLQADKALSMARQTTALKTAGRAARNRANMFYEWDTSSGQEQQRVSKRQRETDDALAKMRAAKAARGLGNGIQLPTSLVDSIELVLANLNHLPSKRPSSAASKRKMPVTLDFVMDAIMTNGASLAQEEGRWYSRDGGNAWTANIENDKYRFEISSKLSKAAFTSTNSGKDAEKKGSGRDHLKVFANQCNMAAGEALGRIVINGVSSRHEELSHLANQIAARLAWAMKGVSASPALQPSHDMALETIESAKKRLKNTRGNEEAIKSFDTLAKSFPLVTSCLALESTSSATYSFDNAGQRNDGKMSLGNCLLNEAYVQACCRTSKDTAEEESWKYKRSLEVMVASTVHASDRSNDKPTDNERKRAATHTASTMQSELSILPSLTPDALTLVSAMCDIDEITKKSAEAARKSSQQSIATSAALHAAKQAAEKRATAALLAIRDAAFQRSSLETRQAAVNNAVGLASGRLPASLNCEDKALKLVMNVILPKSEALANHVVEAATSELERASHYAVENYASIQAANKEALEKEAKLEHPPQKGAFTPDSDEEKHAMDKVRKPAVLFMALCIRRPDIIRKLFELSAAKHADVLSKAVRQSMSKLARAAGAKHGIATIALKVADMANMNEMPLLLAFLDNLAPSGPKEFPPDEFVVVCHEIQEKKTNDGKKDARFLIPIVSAMKRVDLIKKLPEFVSADDKIFLAALVRMGEKLGRHALIFRDEPDSENPTLKGMTLCEELVFLHKLDFAAAGLPQKRYLDAIRLCLDNDELFNDRLVMSALDHISGTFLTGAEGLPLAYMRTIILVCSKHESLHNWICHVLLPRLVEGKIYNDRRQWEGWMRCAKMLENTGDTGVSSSEAISKLPPDQLAIYRARYGNPQ